MSRDRLVPSTYGVFFVRCSETLEDACSWLAAAGVSVRYDELGNLLDVSSEGSMAVRVFLEAGPLASETISRLPPDPTPPEGANAFFFVATRIGASTRDLALMRRVAEVLRDRTGGLLSGS